jgi:hypothetical protein
MLAKKYNIIKHEKFTFKDFNLLQSQYIAYKISTKTRFREFCHFSIRFTRYLAFATWQMTRMVVKYLANIFKIVFNSDERFDVTTSFYNKKQQRTNLLNKTSFFVHAAYINFYQHLLQ